MKRKVSQLLLLTLILGSAFQSGPAVQIDAGYRLCGPSFGGNTAGVLYSYQELQKTALRDTLSAAQLDTLQQVLHRATVSKHWQQKLGGRYSAVEVTVVRQSVPLLVSESGRLVVLFDKPGRRSLAPGHNYFINNTADQIWLRRFAIAATNR